MKKTLLLLLIASATTLAQDPQPQKTPDKDKPIAPTTIMSEKFQLDIPSHKGLFLGKVQVSASNFELTASEATVHLNTEGKPQKFIARGDVKIQRGDRTATARQAEYIVSEQKIILTGDPVVMEKQNRITGNTITIYPETERMDVEGRSTVQIYQ